MFPDSLMRTLQNINISHAQTSNALYHKRPLPCHIAHSPFQRPEKQSSYHFIAGHNRHSEGAAPSGFLDFAQQPQPLLLQQWPSSSSLSIGLEGTVR
jgi:hypothetical protein